MIDQKPSPVDSMISIVDQYRVDFARTAEGLDKLLTVFSQQIASDPDNDIVAFTVFDRMVSACSIIMALTETSDIFRTRLNQYDT